MKVFKLQKPIMNKIKMIVDEKITAGIIPMESDNIKYLDFEPSEGFLLREDLDGAVAVFSPGGSFSESSGSKTEQQNSDSLIRVNIYGFGVPLKNEDDPNEYDSSVREAQKRGEALLTCSFRAIMDRREVEGSPSEGIPKSYGTDLDIGSNRFPKPWRKFSPEGAMSSKLGVCIYQQDFEFRLDESAIQEELGVAFDGSENIQTDATDPI